MEWHHSTLVGYQECLPQSTVLYAAERARGTRRSSPAWILIDSTFVPFARPHRSFRWMSHGSSFPMQWRSTITSFLKFQSPPNVVNPTDSFRFARMCHRQTVHWVGRLLKPTPPRACRSGAGDSSGRAKLSHHCRPRRASCLQRYEGSCGQLHGETPS